METAQPFWQLPLRSIENSLCSNEKGISEKEAQARLVLLKAKQKVVKQWFADVNLLLGQFKNPLVLILFFAVSLSLVLREYSDSLIILTVLLITGILGFIQERNAGRAVQKLRQLVYAKATVLRDGFEKDIPIDDVVPGDIILLNAGDIIPADALIVNAKDLHVNESILTGESFPVEKFSETSNATTITEASNAVFKGTSVINGSATVIAVHTGQDSELGKIASSLEQGVTITAFEKGIMQFGYLLMRLTIIFTGLILVLNIIFHRPFVESLLFSLALAVGLTPELLPAILTITLAAGAKRMAEKKVIVKKLSAIQNLGEIDVLCSDKTGTITEGIVHLTQAVDGSGKESKKLLLYSYLNAFYETGFSNPIDASIRQQTSIDISGYTKFDEVPYDFIRKRLSIVVAYQQQHIMITKGSVKNILDVCSRVEVDSNKTDDKQHIISQLLQEYQNFSKAGFRVIGVCYKDVTNDPVINKDDEADMIFLGFLVFSDPLKKGIETSIAQLKQKGIALKIITGDNFHIATYLGQQINLKTDEVIVGSDLHNLTSDALQRKVEQVNVFAEILPAQKERIVRALQKAGHCVGYMGDGINDANALKVADVGISIDNAVDVAKEAADLVLLDQNIDVINDGVDEGRKTFINTLKYIYVTTSANFGNMFSMAIASLLLPFLPLLPVQILLNNFLSDLPAIAIASDVVDKERIVAPSKWQMKNIRKFMMVFGLQSSLFDFATFALLLFVFKATPATFRTAWFMESLLTQILILLIIRTVKPFFKSRPSKYLLWATLFTFVICISIPYLPFASAFELYPLSAIMLLSILFIVVVYILVAELSKKYLIKSF